MLKAQARPSRCWKNADLELASRLAANLDTSQIIQSKAELKAYAHYLSKFLAKVMSTVVPLQRVLNYANPWWSAQVVSAVSDARKAQC